MSSSIWSSLYTVNSLNLHHVLPAPYYTNRWGDRTSQKTTELKSSMAVADAIAFLGTDAHDHGRVTACGVELTYQSPPDAPTNTGGEPGELTALCGGQLTIRVRLAQHRGIPESDLEWFQNLAGALLHEAQACCWDHDNKENRTLTMSITRLTTDLVFDRCRSCIETALRTSQYAKPFRAWYKELEENGLELGENKGDDAKDEGEAVGNKSEEESDHDGGVQDTELSDRKKEGKRKTTDHTKLLGCLKNIDTAIALLQEDNGHSSSTDDGGSREVDMNSHKADHSKEQEDGTCKDNAGIDDGDSNVGTDKATTESRSESHRAEETGFNAETVAAGTKTLPKSSDSRKTTSRLSPRTLAQAYFALQEIYPSLDDFISLWRKHGYHSRDVDANTMDIDETWTDSEAERTPRPSVYSVLRFLAQYFIASNTIAKELIALYRQMRAENTSICVVVEPIPVRPLTRAPADEGEPGTFEEFYTKHLKLVKSRLDAKSIEGICSAWPTAYTEGKLALHAEMQLFLFYALRPDLTPLNHYIGASRNLCWCCNFIIGKLREVSSYDDLSERDAEERLRFKTRHTNERADTTWLFPNLNRDVASDLQLEFPEAREGLARRLGLLYQMMENVLSSSVRDGIYSHFMLRTPSPDWTKFGGGGCELQLPSDWEFESGDDESGDDA